MNFFRAMKSDGNALPQCGEGARLLGVRQGVDIPVDNRKRVKPNTGGMSVFTDPVHLPYHRKPRWMDDGEGRDPLPDALNEYLTLLDQLIYIRWLHCGGESAEEDQVLEKMDLVWQTLKESDKEYIHSIPSRSLIGTASNRIQMDLDLSPGPRRVMIDRMEAA